MANKDLKIIQEQADGSLKEYNFTPVLNSKLGFDGNGDPISMDLVPLSHDLANIASNTVAVTGPAWGVTTDDKPVFLPAGSTAPADNADWKETGGSPEANAFLESFPNPGISGDLTVTGKITTPEIITAAAVPPSSRSGSLLISTPDGNPALFGHGGNIKIKAGAGGNITLESQPLEGGGSISINAGDGNFIVNASATFGNALEVIPYGAHTGLRVGNGYGLQFGDNTGQILKDYQYGSFTPVLHLNGTTEQSSYAIQEGYYVKIGRLVSVNVSIKVTDFDTAFKTAPSSAEIGIKGLPHSANIEGADGPDTMIVRVNPKKGWIQLGDNSHNGSVGPSPDGIIYFEKNTPQGGTAAGEAWNYERIKVGSFNVHPFNFTADGSKAFTFQVSGAYITDDD